MFFTSQILYSDRFGVNLTCELITVYYFIRYSKLVDLVDQMFPPFTNGKASDPVLAEYSNFSYWRPTLPDMVSLNSLSEEEEMF